MADVSSSAAKRGCEPAANAAKGINDTIADAKSNGCLIIVVINIIGISGFLTFSVYDIYMIDAYFGCHAHKAIAVDPYKLLFTKTQCKTPVLYSVFGDLLTYFSPKIAQNFKLSKISPIILLFGQIDKLSKELIYKLRLITIP